jgi:isopropylmalate/homocitrate/citramalate synthase
MNQLPKLFARSPRAVRVVEVGPRDGLQNEPRPLPTELKVAFVDALTEAGCRHIEVTSFVSPERVPQLADAEEVFRRIQKKEGVLYTALVPNEIGLKRALAAGVRSIALFSAASETFNEKNTGGSIARSFERFRPVLKTAASEGLRVRGYISMAFTCPYEGPIPPERTLEVVKRFRDAGVDNLSLGDTLGAAYPQQVSALLEAIEVDLGLAGFALHLHDTYRRALANALAGLLRGIDELDSSAGGLGGCPFAPGAAGNLATGDLLGLLHSMGITTGIDEKKHQSAVDLIRRKLTVDS